MLDTLHFCVSGSNGIMSSLSKVASSSRSTPNYSKFGLVCERGYTFGRVPAKMVDDWKNRTSFVYLSLALTTCEYYRGYWRTRGYSKKHAFMVNLRGLGDFSPALEFGSTALLDFTWFPFLAAFLSRCSYVWNRKPLFLRMKAIRSSCVQLSRYSI